mmetsp:Transcript_59743/g.159887  ORF Transcript_59743/g.159887 Transcript_59743/m.159887 type:complete len:268 (+) Transcript_59743:724-1527(+)
MRIEAKLLRCIVVDLVAAVRALHAPVADVRVLLDLWSLARLDLLVRLALLGDRHPPLRLLHGILTRDHGTDCLMLRPVGFAVAPEQQAFVGHKSQPAVPTRKTIARICGTHFFVCTALGLHLPEPYFRFHERQVTVLARRIQRVLRTPLGVAVPLVPAALPQHTEGRDEGVPAELTVEAVLRVSIACRSVRVPGRRVIEQLPTEACVTGILGAADLVPVPGSCSRGAEIAGDPEGCDEDLLAVPARVPVARVHLARRSMLLTRLRTH